MKATLTKDASTSHSSKPFFNKKGEGSFFSPALETKEPFFSPSTIQPKLTIGQPNDKYEQEADKMADKVISMPIEKPRPTPQQHPRKEEQGQPIPQGKQITSRIQRVPAGNIHDPLLDQFSKDTGRPRNGLSPHGPGYKAWLMREKMLKIRILQGRVTFENITERERKIFKSIPPKEQESLRKIALQNSKLFKAITLLHLNVQVASRRTGGVKKAIENIENYRLSRRKRNNEYVHLRRKKEKRVLMKGSVADKLIGGKYVGSKWVGNYKSFFSKVLFLENRKAGLRTLHRNRATVYPNKILIDVLANWLTSGSILKFVDNKLCGIANMIVLAVARGQIPYANKKIEEKEVIKWIRDWTFGKPRRQSLIRAHKKYKRITTPQGQKKWKVISGHLTYNPYPCMGSLSAKNKNLPLNKRYLKKGLDLRLKNTPKLRREQLNKTMKKIRLAARSKGDIRVGFAQLLGYAHTIIVYQDMDDVWRTMDLYLDLDDEPIDRKPGDPGFRKSIQKISSVRMILD